MSESNCLFCKIVAGDIPSEKVFETESTYAFRDISPQAAIHVLVVPRAHHEDAEELARTDPAALADVVATAAAVARQEGIDDSGFRMVFNTGENAGRTVFHAHLHLLGGEQLGMFGRHRG